MIQKISKNNSKQLQGEVEQGPILLTQHISSKLKQKVGHFGCSNIIYADYTMLQIHLHDYNKTTSYFLHYIKIQVVHKNKSQVWHRMRQFYNEKIFFKNHAIIANFKN